MLTMRLSVVLVVSALLVACAPQRPQVTSPQQVIATDPVESEDESALDTPLDLLELTILDTDSLLQGCTTEVLYTYGRHNGGEVWVWMHSDRKQPNRFFGAVLDTMQVPTFSVGSRCNNANHAYDGTSGYKEYHGPIELWRRSVHGSWKQLQPRMQYEGWSSN